MTLNCPCCCRGTAVGGIIAVAQGNIKHRELAHDPCITQMCHAAPCFITSVLEEDLGACYYCHDVNSARHRAHGGAAGLLSIFLLTGKILMAFRSCPSVAKTNEKGVACSRRGKPSQDFGSAATLCLLKAMEMVVYLFMPGEDFY